MSYRQPFTSESVTEGHPDKVCDRISDSILDAILAQDPHARVAVETMATTGLIHVAGEVTTHAYVEIPQIVREALCEIGYTSSAVGFDGNSCGVTLSIGQQSPNIASGVDYSLEMRESTHQLDRFDSQGAGDQGLMFGYACNETDALMPLPIFLSHRLAEQLAHVRKAGLVSGLRPDGKTQVTVTYEGNKPVGIETIVVSTQHDPHVSREELEHDMSQEVVRPILERYAPDFDMPEKILVNPSGTFIIGGPMGDAGLTGRKIIVDTYGGMARHGGGAFSGKDPSKVDRSAAYAARYVAKNVVAAELASRCEIQVAYAIGQARPVSVNVETFGTATVSEDKLRQAVMKVFDLRPAAIIENLDLLKPIYAPTSAYGHFGRVGRGFTWENTDKVEELLRAI